MKHKATKKEIREIERELMEQSHRIVFGTRVHKAVNPEHEYSV